MAARGSAAVRDKVGGIVSADISLSDADLSVIDALIVKRLEHVLAAVVIDDDTAGDSEELLFPESDVFPDDATLNDLLQAEGYSPFGSADEPGAQGTLDDLRTAMRIGGREAVIDEMLARNEARIRALVGDASLP
jgi:hypothetical protein